MFQNNGRFFFMMLILLDVVSLSFRMLSTIRNCSIVRFVVMKDVIYLYVCVCVYAIYLNVNPSPSYLI